MAKKFVARKRMDMYNRYIYEKKEGTVMGKSVASFAILAYFIVALCLTSFIPANAQPPKKILEVAIVDFDNLSKYDGKVLGRRAADAVALALSTMEEYYLIVPRDELEREVQAQGLAYPLDKTDLLLLGRALGLDGIIIGNVVAVEIKRGEATQAGVTVACQMLDISTEEPITGALVTATSSPKYDYKGEDDILVDEALNKAAYQISKQFLSFAVRGIPEYAILTTIGNEVLINAGSRQGIKEGMQMVVLRRGEKVGRVKVKEVTLTDATATILEAPRGIQSGDKVRVVYETPPLTKLPAEMEMRKKARSSLQNTIPALLLAFGIYKLMQQPATSGPKVSTCYACQEGGHPYVYLSWDFRKIPNPTNIYAIMVYRTGPGGGPPPTGPSDADLFTCWSQRVYPGVATPSYCVDRTYNAPPTVTRYIVSEDGTSVETEDITVTPLIPGESYHYYLRAITVYTPLAPGGTTGGGTTRQQEVEYRYTEFVYLGRYTPLYPPTPAYPANGATVVDLSNVTFQWTAAAGANEYVLEISTDPSFPADKQKTWRSAPQYIWASAGEVVPVEGLTLNLSKIFPKAKVLYWRVGAINNKDTQRPPGGYIFGEQFYRINVETPPPPP